MRGVWRLLARALIVWPRSTCFTELDPPAWPGARSTCDAEAESVLRELRLAVMSMRFERARVESTPLLGFGISRMEVRTTSSEAKVPLKWLKRQRGMQRCYFASPANGGNVFAGVGASDIIDGIGPLHRSIFKRAAQLPAEAAYIGGARFAPSASPNDEWRPFRGHTFVLPLVSVEHARSELLAACHFFGNSTALETSQHAIISALDMSLANSAETLFEAASVAQLILGATSAAPQPIAWCKTVSEALSQIHAGLLDKVVVAQRRSFFFERSPEALHVLDALQAENDGLCYSFALQIEVDGAVFFGCSPESLFEIKIDGCVTVDSIAGTRRRGKSEDADNALATELLTSRKDAHENAIVASFVAQKLQRLLLRGILISSVKIDTVSLLKLPSIMHLKCKLTAQLAPFYRQWLATKALIDALHPTPAVLGLPPKTAAQFLETHEDFDRGFYAGPFGAMRRRDTTFTVAIRSALLLPKRNALFAYAGAGLVRGSDAEAELQEIDNKIKPIDTALKHIGLRSTIWSDIS